MDERKPSVSEPEPGENPQETPPSGQAEQSSKTPEEKRSLTDEKGPEESGQKSEVNGEEEREGEMEEEREGKRQGEGEREGDGEGEREGEREEGERVGERIGEEPEEPYNPFQHRNVKRPTSDFGALSHMLKTSLGSGILAMPMAFKNSGLVFGTFGTIFLGVVCTHCIQMLISNSQILCAKKRVPTLTFAETTENAFLNGPPSAKRCAKCMGVTVTIQLLGSFILGSSVYVVIMSQTMYQVVDFFAHTAIPVRYYILMLWIPLILTCLVRDLKTLVPFSIIAILFVIVSFSIILYYIFRDMNRPENVNLIAPFQRLPLFITTVIFAIEGIGTVMSIENEMKHPEHFLGGRCPIAYISMTIVVVVYGFIGFFGYLEYGELTRGSITLNLPLDDPLAQSVKLLIALAIFLTYPLQFYVPINLIYEMIKHKTKPKYHKLVDIMVRVMMVTLTIIIGLVIPNLEPIITLVGAIAFALLGLMMPSLIDTMARYPHFGVWKWRLIKNIIISGISIIALISGTYTSVRDILSSYS